MWGVLTLKVRLLLDSVSCAVHPTAAQRVLSERVRRELQPEQWQQWYATSPSNPNRKVTTSLRKTPNLVENRKHSAPKCLNLTSLSVPRKPRLSTRKPTIQDLDLQLKSDGVLRKSLERLPRHDEDARVAKLEVAEY